MAKAKDITIHMIGHGHIDPTWLWRWTEGYEEVRATFRSALDRMKETPQFKFTASSACFYGWAKAADPDLFEEIRHRVKEGRWEIVGGWWVEPDCNIPCGESFVRHGLYSQRFFEREFGRRATVGFNPDSFGHAGTLPQLLKKMGLDYYVYARPEPHEMSYPDGNTFRWRASDGSEVIAANIPYGYGASGSHVIDKIKRLPSHPCLNPGQTHILGFYGVGNHGGGPTKEAIAAILKTQGDKTLPHAKFSTLREYFGAFLEANTPMPVIQKELQHHARGCYTAHSEVKRLNRSAEHALMAAERFATVAWLVYGMTYSNAEFEKSWCDVLYNQFHDVLAGTSIEKAYEDSRDQLGRARFTAQTIQNEAIQTIARAVDTSASGNTIMVVNPLPWRVKQVVTVPPIAARGLTQPLHIADETGKTVPSQAVLGERIGHTAYAFTADVPGLGYRCYHARSGAKSVKLHRPLDGERDRLENRWWRIEFHPTDGHITRLFDRRNRIEVLSKGNVLAAMVDCSDTWSHGYDEFRVEAGRFGNASLDLIEMGDVRATVRIVSHFRDSRVEQCVTLYREVPHIDCMFRLNWQERYTMLKLGYETGVCAGVATYDIPYGFQVRDTEGFEEPGQQWFDLTGRIAGKPYGLAVLNDSKYGFDVRGNVMRISLLRSPAYAHHDRGRYDSSTPFAIMDQGWQTVRIRLLPHAGPWQLADVVRAAWELNEPAFAHVESAHKGKLPTRASFLETSADNVVFSTLKKSEEDDDLIVRGYEITGKPAKTTLRFPQLRKTIETTFAPHEIKTLRINPKLWKAREVNLLEE